MIIIMIQITFNNHLEEIKKKTVSMSISFCFKESRGGNNNTRDVQNVSALFFLCKLCL